MIKRKKRAGKKKKNKLSNWKTNMLLKRDDFQIFFEKKKSLSITNFWKKTCLHLKGECREIFPSAQNGLGWMHKLVKEHILETLGWLKIEEMNHEP